MKREKSEYVIQTVRNCLHVLEAFEGKEELGVTELADTLGLHKNNVFRLLATLADSGYVEKNEDTDRYRLGVSCLALAHSFSRNRSLMVEAREVVSGLAAKTGETAHLATLSAFEVMHLDGEQPDRLVVTGVRVGTRLPAHCTALGKVLLGCGAPGLLESYDHDVLSAGPVEAYTPSTLVDRHKLIEHLRAVGAQGWATDQEECEEGLCCAAAPVLDGTGRLVAALSVSGPAFRLGTELLTDQTLPTVVSEAQRLSRLLGHA
jgi:DNA-binding IclR family transcriptional regulator